MNRDIGPTKACESYNQITSTLLPSLSTHLSPLPSPRSILYPHPSSPLPSSPLPLYAHPTLFPSLLLPSVPSHLSPLHALFFILYPRPSSILSSPILASHTHLLFQKGRKEERKQQIPTYYTKEDSSTLPPFSLLPPHQLSTPLTPFPSTFSFSIFQNNIYITASNH